VSGTAESGGAPPPWSELRARLAARGFRPSRRLGQSFLIDDNMARAIARDADLEPGARVLEVGAGLGVLTLSLLEAGADVLAVEIDPRLCELARERLGERPRLRWILADALSGKHRLAPEVERELPRQEPWHLVSNLPYSISAPLLAILTDREHPPRTMTALVQLEVAERVVAAPGGAAWGPLSVRLQAAYRASLGRRLAPALFWPRPAVESALVRLELSPEAEPLADRRRLGDLAGRLFQHRRQTLARALGDLLADRALALDLLAAGGIDPRSRAEVLTLDQLRTLVRRLPCAE